VLAITAERREERHSGSPTASTSTSTTEPTNTDESAEAPQQQQQQADKPDVKYHFSEVRHACVLALMCVCLCVRARVPVHTSSSAHDTLTSTHTRRPQVTYGKVYRAFKLPSDADADSIKASLESGVLTVTLPKREGPRERTVAIQ
jgi:hypothetical protein